MQLKTLGLQGANSIDIVRIATQNMSNADFAAALSTTALTEAERLQLIAGRQLTDAELEKALATNTSSAANVGATVTTFSLAGAFNSLKTAIKGVGIAMMSNPITAIITVALTAITVISRVKAHIDNVATEIKEKSEEAANSIQEVSDAFQKTTETVDNIGKRFAELAQGVDSLTGKNISLTTDEYSEFLNLSNQLAELFPSLTRHYDENGNAIVNLSGDVDTIVGSLKNLVDVQRQVANQNIAEQLPDLYAGTIQKSREYQADAKMYQDEIQGTLSAWEGINGGFINGNMLTVRAPVDTLEELEKVEQIYLSVLDDLGIAYQYADNLDGIRYKINSFSNMSASEISNMTSQIESSVKEALLADTSLNKYFDDSYRDIEKYSGLVESSINKNKSNWAGLTQALTSWLSTDTTYQALSDEMQSIVQMMVNNVDFAELDFDTWEEASQYIIDSIIVPISEASDEVQQAYIDLFSLDSNLSYSTYMANAQKAISAIASGLGKSYEEIAKAVGYDNTLDDLQKKRDKVLNSLFSYGEIRWGGGANKANSLSAAQINQAYSYITNYGVKTWKELQSAFANNTYGQLIDLESETESLKNFNTAISESASATGMSADSLTNLSERYKDVEGHEAALSNLYTKTSTGIRVNVKSARELEKAYNSQKKEQQIKQIDSLKKKYKELTDEMRGTTDATKYAELYNQRANIAAQIDDATRLASQYQALASYYNAWQAAMNSSNPSDPYSNIQSGYDKIGELIEQGWAYKDEVDTYLDLLLNPDVRTNDNVADYDKLGEKISNTNFSIKDFFVTDDDGNLVSDGVFNFLDAIKEGLGEDYVKILSDGTYWWDLTGDKAEAVAKYLGVSTEFVDWMQQALKDITGDFTEESMFGDLVIDAKDAEEALSGLLTKIDDSKNKYNLGNIYLNSNNLKDVNQYIENIGNLIKDNFLGKDGKIDISVNGAEEATIVLTALIQQKAELTAPAIMSIDTEALDSTDVQLANAIELLQQFITLSVQLETQKSLGLDTTNTQTQLVNVSNTLNGLPKEIKTKIGIDGEDVSKSITNIANTNVTAGVKLKDGDIDTVKKTIAGIDPKTIELLTNSDDTIDDLNEVEKFTIHDKPFKVKMSGYSAAMGNMRNLDSFQFDTKVITIRTEYIDGDIDGSGRAQGTAHARGTAFVWGSAYQSGDWGVKKDEVALASEVGTEIVVRDGHFFTIGENGAEFFHFKKNDIVFNAEQSRQLLENGKITNGKKRGVVYANGTAYANGTPYASGGSTGTGSRRRTTIEQQVEEATAEEVSNVIPDVDDYNADDSFKYIDRVEILLDRIHRKIDAVKDSISDVFSLWSDRGDNITKQIGNITDEIGTQEAAAKRYLEEARKQIDKYGLDPDWVKSIEEGNIGFIYLTNLDELHEGYEEYKKWYEKYLDARDTIQGLNNDLSQLYKDEFDNIKSNYDNQIDLNEYLQDSNEKTYTQSTTYFDDMRNIYQGNLGLLTKEAQELEAQLQKAVNEGKIEEGSEAWQEMRKDINDVKKEIASTNVELAKLYTEQFEYIENNYKNQIDSYQSLNDANEKNFTVTTNYYKEMREISNKTLKAQQDELAELEDEFAKAMDSGRIEEGSEAWYKMRSAIDDTKRSISKTKVELKQLYLDEFNYMQDNYKNQLSLYEHTANMYSKRATSMETRGYVTSSTLLNKQAELQQKNYSLLREELISLEDEYARIMATGEIEKYSAKWYELTNSINAVKEAMYDSRIEAEKLFKAMEQVDEDKFALQQSMISQQQDESDFFINLMSFTDLHNKKGTLTDAGLATLGLHNYNVDVNSTLKRGYDEEIARVDERYRLDPYNIDYLKYRQELVQNRREAVIAIENEEKAMISLAENGIKLELNKLKELIQTYKDGIDKAKDLYDYSNQISDKTKKITDLQKQISAYAGDTSEETKAVVQKLQVDITDAQKDLNDTEYSRMVTDQKKLLDSLYDEYEAFLNSRLDDRDALLNDLKNSVNSVPGAIHESLTEVANAVGVPLSEGMNNTWQQAADNIRAWNETQKENHAADQQITEKALLDTSNSWATFGEGLNTRQDFLNMQEGEIVLATNNTTQGINKVWGDIGVAGGQTLVEKADEDYVKMRGDMTNDKNDIVGDITTGITNGVSDIDGNDSNINSNLSMANDTLKDIKDFVEKIQERAEEAATPYMGDVNLDDNVDSADALKVLRGAVALERLTESEKALADVNGDGQIDSADSLMILRMGIGLEDKVKVKAFSTGGLNDTPGLAMLHGTKEKPELVLNANDTKNFINFNDTLREMERNQTLDFMSGYSGIEAPPLQLTKLPSFTSGMSSPDITQDVNVTNNIKIERVLDYNDFVNQMVRDKKYEKFIQSISIDRLGNGRPLDKYKYRW